MCLYGVKYIDLVSLGVVAEDTPAWGEPETVLRRRNRGAGAMPSADSKVNSKLNSSCKFQVKFQLQIPAAALYAPALPLPQRKTPILGVIYRVLLWADMNAATPLGAWGRAL